MYKEQREYQKARHFLEMSVNGCTKLYGSGHAQTLQRQRTLADLYVHEEEYEQARDLFEYVLKKQNAIYDSQHPELLITLAKLGSLYRKQGDFERAEPIYIRVWKREKKLLGPFHHDTLLAKYNTGVLFFYLYDLFPNFFVELHDFIFKMWNLIDHICPFVSFAGGFEGQEKYEQAIFYAQKQQREQHKIRSKSSQNLTIQYDIAVYLKKTGIYRSPCCFCKY